MSGVAYGPLPISGASLRKVMGVVCSHIVLPVWASSAVTVSCPGRPYIVYRTLPSTDGDEYPSPSGRFQITFGPAAGQAGFKPLVSVVKLRCGPPHCVQATPSDPDAAAAPADSRKV